MDSFRLGVHVEELYCIFNEQVQTALGGVPEATYDALDRNIRWARGILVAWRAPDLPEVLLRAKGQMKRGTGGFKPTQDVITASKKTAGEISQMMSRIRDSLDDVEGLRYDVGVMSARFSFCARAYAHGHGEPRTIYARELVRVSGALLDIIARAQEQGLIAAAFTEEDSMMLRPFIRALIPVAKSHGNFPDDVAAAHDAVDEVTAHFGFKLITNADAPTAG